MTYSIVKLIIKEVKKVREFGLEYNVSAVCSALSLVRLSLSKQLIVEKYIENFGIVTFIVGNIMYECRSNEKEILLLH